MSTSLQPRPRRKRIKVSKARSAMMRGNTRKNTKPELALRRLVHSRGLRYRIDTKPSGIRYAADLIFTQSRVAIFVDGCFWHACEDHWTAPKTRERFWRDKARENRLRDRKASAAYRARGWMVLRVWEHDHGKFEAFADRIFKAVWRRMPPR
jgi:DNA mismatch endonuclease (patch repair protein)